MQFTAITALILTMAAGAIAAPPHAVGDRLAVLKRGNTRTAEEKRSCGKRDLSLGLVNYTR
ncbi:hypothetical protein WAI453_011373 [Rhynchosporium graminicola]